LVREEEEEVEEEEREMGELTRTRSEGGVGPYSCLRQIVCSTNPETRPFPAHPAPRRDMLIIKLRKYINIKLSVDFLIVELQHRTRPQQFTG
jgi:hypothetical protein